MFDMEKAFEQLTTIMKEAANPQAGPPVTLESLAKDFADFKAKYEADQDVVKSKVIGSGDDSHATQIADLQAELEEHQEILETITNSLDKLAAATATRKSAPGQDGDDDDVVGDGEGKAKEKGEKVNKSRQTLGAALMRLGSAPGQRLDIGGR
jgi:hypothetical protein